MPMILVTGACGQIGTELVSALRKIYSAANVLATDLRDRSETPIADPYYALNVLNAAALDWFVINYKVTHIYHLAAVLSAKAEDKPLDGWNLNIDGLLNVLETARKHQLKKVFWPSSIAVYGPASGKTNCPQSALPDPMTAYGISKIAGEYWCRYYRDHYECLI